MLKIEHGTKSFGSQNIFTDVSLTIDHPGLFALWGESGSGKSTLLNIIAGLDSLDHGVCQTTSSIMTIFQNYELIPQLNVMDNIFLGKPCSEDNRKLLKTLQIDHILDHYPDELSGGQKQRVGIARALISEPGMICCDEPTESLDIENRQIVMHLLKEYSKDHIVIMATHQKDAVEQYADYVITIEDHSLLTTTLHETEGAFAKEKYLRIDQKNIRHMMRKITWKKNILFIVIFSVLLMLSQGSSILKQIMFQIPDTTDTLNRDMIYVRADSQESLKQAGFSGTQILSFLPVVIDETEYTAGIYPYPKNSTELHIEGSLPEELNVLINQNAAEIMFDGERENRNLDLDIQLEQTVWTIPVTVTGVVDEPDTDAMQIYYNLDDIEEYLRQVQRPLGGSLYGAFVNDPQLFEIQGNYENMAQQLTVLSDASFQAFSPLFEQRQKQMQESEIYRYLFTGFTVIITVLLCISVIVIVHKETDGYRQAFAILVSQNIPAQQIRRTYFRIRILLLLCVAIPDVLILFLLQNQFEKLYILPLGFITLITSVLYVLSILRSLSALKENRISTIMKEEI